MNEHELEQIVTALERYFDQAHPTDHGHNARLFQAHLAQYSQQALIAAPAVLVQGLRNAAEYQTLQAIQGANEAELDRQLQEVGLFLLLAYASLLRAAGSGGVLAVRTALPMLLRQDEDAVTLTACALAVLLRDAPPLISTVLTGELTTYRDLFERARRTACKIALAFLMLACGQREPFQTYAPQYLALPERRAALRALIRPHDPDLTAWTLGMIVMDLASGGSALPPELGWRR